MENLKLELRRFESSNQGTFGTLVVPDEGTNYYFYTGELPWRDNKPNLSCIPVGTYKASKTYSDHFKRSLYLVQSIPNRDGVRIHSANLMGDETKGFKNQIKGCIILGEKLGFMDGQRCILLSTPAIRRFEALMDGRDFTLEIS